VKFYPVILTSLAFLAVMPAVLPAHAQTKTIASTAMTDGVVRRVDKTNKSITIKHGDITNLNMGAMTMVFEVKKAGLLDKLQAGDKVRFHAEQEGDKLIVTEISAVK
jgi:Cu/Ag efflux protein CusF